MEGVFILLVAALVVCVQGTSHLSFSNNTEVDITLAGCGATKVCVSTPDNCDPAGQSACLFMSRTTSPTAANVVVELRGDSGGYIALGLIANASQGTTMLFVCAANTTSNGAIFFRTLQKNNTDEALIPTETRVKEIRGTVDGTVIKCEFNIESLNASDIFNVLLGTGTVTAGVGPFEVALNVADGVATTPPPTTMPTTTMPTTTMTNTTMTNTTMTNTTMTNSGGAVRPHAVLLLLSVLTLSVMLRA
ncbi:putative ferric-chelate reductase 1 isoform X2 [Cyclopterus lumpus]|uniref:putative ferric-chelate reductase 1 isoform X2 n=1 Tax=Cyclopterus lumpus TaxID=8103 RepID=UPI001485EE7A|nr:putative ferric-chelate reductase 1 isoform X2 [Cyclopterus lumpus]